MDRATPSQSRNRGGVAAGQGSLATTLRMRDMELLLAIHEHKSVTSAALQLGFTQPAASRALRDMEQLLRVHLFERDRIKGMSLTEAGELVLARARALLADYQVDDAWSWTRTGRAPADICAWASSSSCRDS